MSAAVDDMTKKAGDDPAAQMAAQFAKTMSASNSITMEFRPDGTMETRDKTLDGSPLTMKLKRVK